MMLSKIINNFDNFLMKKVIPPFTKNLKPFRLFGSSNDFQYELIIIDRKVYLFFWLYPLKKFKSKYSAI